MQLTLLNRHIIKRYIDDRKIQNVNLPQRLRMNRPLNFITSSVVLKNKMFGHRILTLSRVKI